MSPANTNGHGYYIMSGPVWKGICMNREDFIRMDKEDAAFEELEELAVKLHAWCVKYDMPRAMISASSDSYSTHVDKRDDFRTLKICNK